MDKSEAITMLKVLIANLERDHIRFVEVHGEEDGSLVALTLIISGEPVIGKDDEV